MFIHNFKYALKTLLKNKALIFWTFAFPIILGTLFNMAFSNIENSEKLKVIDVAVVESESLEKNEVFSQALKVLGDEENEDRLFNIKYVNEDEAKRLLEDKEISGYILFTDVPKVVIQTNGINETIIKYVVEEIAQTSDIAEGMIEKKIKAENFNNYSGINEGLNIDFEKIYRDAVEMSQNQEVNIENISNKNLSYTMIEFYTLIAMVCLYGGILGMVSINQNLANMSNNGKRVSVSPTSKAKLILSSSLASYLVQIVGLAILFVYTVVVLKVDYGDNLLQIVLLSLVGCLAGLSLGIAIATLVKANEGTKTGIVISITMLGCFLSGMMGITMKYIVDKNVPIVNKINPASMITDGFYSLYYYDTFDRFYFNIISLLIFSVLMITISMFSLRRQKYDSI